MWWTYYRQFDCQFVEPECRRSALDFLHVFDKLARRDDTVTAALANRPAEKTVSHLREWANDSTKAVPADGSLSLTNVLLFLTIYRSQIEELISAQSANTGPEMGASRRGAKIGKLPSNGEWALSPAEDQGRFAGPDGKSESHSPSIIVVGDIRRSQDLMTYAMDGAGISQKRMIEFISKTRLLLDRKYGGFFRQVYRGWFSWIFSTSRFARWGIKLRGQFPWALSTKFTRFCNAHFREWVQFVCKVPKQACPVCPSGLMWGVCPSKSLDYHVIAVSESIVWASRHGLGGQGGRSPRQQSALPDPAPAERTWRS